MSQEQETPKELTAAQISLNKRKRIKAQNFRRWKLVSHPYSATKIDTNANSTESSVVEVDGTKFVDSGFRVESLTASEAIVKQQLALAKTKEDLEPPVEYPLPYKDCLDCGDKVYNSYLLDVFDYAVCDKCHDPDGKHELISRTDAKAEYLLQDCDLDRRKPVLRYISKQNPHNNKWDKMKLYLALQVMERAIEVWGSEEALEKQREELEKREISRIKKYNKQSLAAYEHDFGPATYNSDDNTYTRVCTICQYSETLENM